MARTLRFALIVVLVSATAWAQGWRGQGRVAGKVTDEAGKPIDEVVVKLALPSEKGDLNTKTNSKGEWSVGGIGRGEWQIDFTKKGYEARHITVAVAEMSRLPQMEITLKKSVDPNEVIATQMKVAAELMTQKKYSEARAAYEALLAKYPQAYQIEQFVARTYYLEGQPDKAIERLRGVLQNAPNALEVRLLLGSLLLEAGKADEGRQVLAAVDESKISDPAIYVNFGIAMMNKNQIPEALGYFEKAIARFPQAADAYYYRAITLLQMSGAQGEEAQKADRLQKVKADLGRFLQLAPTAPEADNAKKILDQLRGFLTEIL